MAEKEPYDEKAKAKLALSPVTSNAATACEYSKQYFGKVDFQGAVKVITEHADQVTGGDMSSLESMLTAQAFSLNAMFNDFAKRANNENAHATENLLRLALKAQNQSRTTIETLAEVKAYMRYCKGVY